MWPSHLELQLERVGSKGAALGQRRHGNAVFISAARAGGLVPAQLHGAAARGGDAQVGGFLGGHPAGAQGGRGGAGRLGGGLHGGLIVLGVGEGRTEGLQVSVGDGRSSASQLVGHGIRQLAS